MRKKGFFRLISICCILIFLGVLGFLAFNDVPTPKREVIKVIDNERFNNN